jgi:hypothetical protein
VKTLRLSGLLACLLILTQPIAAQESALAEKIRDISPDKKFAMRIRYDAEENKTMIEDRNGDPHTIFPEAIKAVDLVSLTSKEVVANLAEADSYMGGVSLVWSQDSNWCAYYSMSGIRVGETYVYNRDGEDFHKFETEGLQVDVKGDVKNDYARPIRWLKPGVLVLEEFAIFRGGEGSATYRFTASFDEKTRQVPSHFKEKTSIKGVSSCCVDAIVNTNFP